jgi:hypothetical protein
MVNHRNQLSQLIKKNNLAYNKFIKEIFSLF